ncbi:hypothetical protein ACJJTC_001008 [Scirpophaga incertulas]
MSSVFSKKKEKRSRSSSNEANNSFVKNVTSKVTGLLPATITKWFSSPSTSNANGATSPTADGTDSSTEDETTDTPVATQPPPKRMRFSSPINATTNVDSFEQHTPYSTIQSPHGRNSFRRETNFVSIPMRASKEESTIEKSKKSVYKPFSRSVPSVSMRRKSIFDTDGQMSNTTQGEIITPRFNSGLLTSSFYSGRTTYGGASSSYINYPNIKERKVAVVKESNKNTNNTMSQAARRVLDLLEDYSSPLAEAKRIAPYINGPVNDSQSISNSSKSSTNNPSRNICNKTNQLYVPNIASILRLKHRSRLMDTTRAARQIIASHSSTLSYPMNHDCDNNDESTKNKLTTKIKTKITKQRCTEMETVHELTAPVNLPTSVLQIDKNNLPKFTFGIPATSASSPNAIPKFNLTSNTSTTLEQKSDKKMEDKACNTIELSKPVYSNFTLDMAASSTPNIIKLCEPQSVSKKHKFYKFSNPVRITSDEPPSSHSPAKFKFGSPDRGVDKMPLVEKKDDDIICVVGPVMKDIEKKSIPKTNDWKCPDCWVNNKMNSKACVCCGAKQPGNDISKISKCVVCKLSNNQINNDKCVNCQDVQNKIYPIQSPIKSVESGKWKCDECWIENEVNVKSCVCCGNIPSLSKNSSDVKAVCSLNISSNWKCQNCWVQNEGNLEKCVCCGISKSNTNPVETNSYPTKLASHDASKIDQDWKCNDCWLKNKSDVDKCVACGGSNPGLKQSHSTTFPKITIMSPVDLDKNLKNIVSSQNEKWECPSCLVRNDDSISKCVCCDVEKPGTVKEIAKTTFNFGMNTNTTFKFGIDPKVQEKQLTKSSNGKLPEFTKILQEPETNNNILPKTPTFTFGVPAKKQEIKTDITKKREVKESTKKAFTFGTPQMSEQVKQDTAPVFGSSSKLVESVIKNNNEENEKLQEVPKVDLSTVKEHSSSSLSIMLRSPMTPQASQEKPLLASLQSHMSNNDNKLQSATKGIPLGSMISNQETNAHSSFAFSGSTIKLATNLFNLPVTTSSLTVSLPTAPPATSTVIFQAPDKAITSPLSHFEKPETVTTSKVSLFEKTEPSSVTVNLNANTTPVFSFGSNGVQTSAPQSEKPKFNFTFGGSDKLFNNTFGTHVADNKFTASTIGASGNGLAVNIASNGGGGALTSNTMGGNGLAPNTLGGNGLASNTLSSNETTGNEIKAGPGLFGVPVTKENLWTTNNKSSNNLFSSTTSSTNLQKSGSFAFGATTFNSGTPSFGNNTSPAQSVFGINQNTSVQPSIFSSSAQNKSSTSMFGAPQPGNNAMPAVNMFGTANVGASTFGTPNSNIPTFQIATVPASGTSPGFNFKSPETTAGFFGFGQAQQTAQPQSPAQQSGVYNFGGASGSPALQFNMGSAPNNSGRRVVRKAVRRSNQR